MITTPADLEPGTIRHRVEVAEGVHRVRYDVLGTPSGVRLVEEAAMAAIGPGQRRGSRRSAGARSMDELALDGAVGLLHLLRLHRQSDLGAR